MWIQTASPLSKKIPQTLPAWKHIVNSMSPVECILYSLTVGCFFLLSPQELCRQRMAVKTSDRPEPLHASRINSVSSQFSDGPIPSPSARSSTSSWCEEPVQSNMDISTGHMILVSQLFFKPHEMS